ncbi:c-type cytochrome [Noviherbaspirillum pedocola]|uniref:Cytochrome c n=1 Tax=Noviherbaspirillum pedocola TaxID=2801341 RepID=A0A934W7G7_9BURK|nr:cytochrome c [Noviherbaspirillum pedocola]MBK4734664.1 cytochrome c [Noviherbaspirillum pedocola]
MMRATFIGLTISELLFLSLPAHSQMGMGPGMGMGHGMMNMSMVRHHFAMMNGIDPRYASMENPLQANSQNIDGGKKLFEQNCARCHGVTGRGDGRDGESLNPRPANVAAASKMPMATDGYLYWTITEGGVPLGTGMPAFGGVLKEQEIWEIITYLRVL